MTALIEFVNNFFTMLFDGFLWIAKAVGEVISYVFYLIFDGLLTVIYLFASTIDLAEVTFNMAAEYSSLPPQLIWLINEVDLPQSMTYVVGSIIVRATLNLIPAAITRI